MAQIPNNKSKINGSNIIIMLLLTMAIVGIILMFTNSSTKKDELEFNDFTTYLENGDLSSMTLTPAKGSNYTLFVVEGEYFLNGQKKSYVINLPQEYVNNYLLNPDSIYKTQLANVEVKVIQVVMQTQKQRIILIVQ